MAVQTPALNSFAAGELSPFLDGRTDLAKYFIGVRTLLNMICFPTGGATRRGGTKFIGEVKNGYNAASAVRLIPFEFSTTQAYMMEVGNNYIRFMMDQGQILWTADPNQQSHTFDAYGSQWVYSDLSVSGGFIGWNSASFALDVYAASNTATGWAHKEFANLQSPEVHHRLTFYNYAAATPIYVGVGDVRFMNTISWDLYPLTAQNIGTQTVDFDPAGATQVYIGLVNANKGSATVDNVILARKYYEISSPYDSDDLFELDYTQDADTMFISHPEYPPQELTRTGHQNFTIGNVPFKNSEFTSADNYPAKVSFFEGRSAWAATNNYPQTIWLSETTDIYDMAVGTNAASAIKAPIKGSKVNVIRWMLPLTDLVFGTTGGEWRIGSTTSADPVSPDNISARQPDSEGSANVRPIDIKGEGIFCQYHGQRVMRLGFTYKTSAYYGSWESEDLGLFSDHIIAGDDNEATVIEMAFQKYPNRIIWVVRSDGVLAACTYNRAQDIVSWHRHTTGEGDKFESGACIPGIQKDDVYFIVHRVINGVDKRYIEILSDERIRDINDGRFLDCYLDYVGDNNSSVLAVSGLEHLNGAMVSVSIDGASHPDRVVVDGAITLTNRASQVVVGLPYTSRLTTMRLEAGSEMGSALGKIKRISRAIILFFRSAGCKYGTDVDYLDTLAWRLTADGMDRPPALVSDAVEVTMPGDWERGARITIEQSLPLPLTVLGIVPTVDTSEE